MFDLDFLLPPPQNYLSPAPPVEELDCGPCGSCGTAIVEYFDGDDYYCESCADAIAQQWLNEAEAFANERCKITCELPAYDRCCVFRCTPEEDEDGFRESNTQNGFLCQCRQNCTNFEELIAGLGKYHAKDRV